MTIAMTDLVQQYQALREEIDAAVSSVLMSGHFVLGPNVTAFEQELARYCGVEHALTVASGTDALHLSLRAAGIGEGDEVITTPFTFIGTAEAISYTGARPVFVDIEADTFNIDARQVVAAVGPRTRAIVAVHLFGQPADLDTLKATCSKHGLILIEDCAQSFGADYRGRKTGTHGDLGCFSFYPSKNLGGFGDGGLVITGDDRLADTVRSLRNHGACGPYRHGVVGYNSRLDELQAAILRVKLKYIDQFNAARRANAPLYNARLRHPGIAAPVERGHGTHVYHQYTIRSDKRDDMRRRLADAGIASAVYYPIPLHQQPVYSDAYAGVSMPAAEQAAEQVLSLPMYPELSEQQIDTVCRHVLDAL